MKNNAIIFSERMEELFGEADIIRPMNAPHGKPIYVFIYRDLPEEGMTTFVTYGLSEADHPDWKHGKPELILTLDTKDEDWGYAIGFFATHFQGEKNFSYGSLFSTDTPLTKESDMIGFFVFAPAILERGEDKIETAGKPIYLAGMYPLYKEEFALYQRIGLEKFWHLDGFEIFNVKRKNLAK